VRCPSCGNENPGTNRFCGSCGAALAPAMAVQSVAPRAAQQSQPPARESEYSAPAARDSRGSDSRDHDSRDNDSPVISGPSFLGLNQPGPATTPRRSVLGLEPHARPVSRSLDYLLDEEDEPRSGAWRYILLLVMLAAALGYGYYRWKSQTQGWTFASKPAATQGADNPGGSTTAPAAASPEAAKSDAAPKNDQPAADASPNTPAADGASKPESKDLPAAGATADNGASDKNAPDSKKNASDSDSAAAEAPSGSSPNSKAASKAAAQPDAGATADKPKPQPARAAKPSPALTRPAESNSNAIAEATRYIYGRGTSQDCDRGLRLLKPAANQSDPRAMIQMGALYSAGLCAPRDLPTAYRWFALALRKEPDNTSVQNDLQKLWGEMTQPERQLAIRLTH
jgi:zinc-ribbon domain